MHPSRAVRLQLNAVSFVPVEVVEVAVASPVAVVNVAVVERAAEVVKYAVEDPDEKVRVNSIRLPKVMADLREVRTVNVAVEVDEEVMIAEVDHTGGDFSADHAGLDLVALVMTTITRKTVMTMVMLKASDDEVTLRAA